ncbi:lysM domain receptor-like kinase 4 isoform X1 [Spinacia oleracea]|uniref:LysM domain receptor-like kinase 4 isoform X1 n=1 Tax=Spinacia oleracea TaxID=3562 RepID=A0A9R0IEI8_SPIOL|nr:lysM domain receptor-like kinase 4 isoform X1 [Spinacia oleracea]
MGSPSFIHAFILSSIYFFSLITAQQPYASSNCRRNESSSLGYNCNGVKTSCNTFLIYRTQPPYNNISSIATLFSANASQISAINNNVTENTALATNTKVIIPVTCSCAGGFYQANTTHVVIRDDNYYKLANNTFEGLTTCRAIRAQKLSPNIVDIFPGERLTIPLRCACPTKRQLNLGIKYLMSFVIQPSNPSIGGIATYFGADVGQTFEANGKSEQDYVIQPFTTLLVPLQNPPNGSQMEYPPYVPPPTSSPPSLPPIATPLPLSSGNLNKKWVYFGLGAVAGGIFISLIGLFFFFVLPRKKTNPIVSSSTHNFEAQETALLKQTPEKESLDFLENISKIASLKVYSSKDLHSATKNFSSDHWIKGSVYKGSIDGEEVVIKKMDGDVSKEISVLNKINHFNLIKLLGVCFDDGVWYFVYEYADNGSLRDWIYPDGKTLSWEKRMVIACDVATGLNYLHSYTNPAHIHQDIRSNNVLLNKEFRAKIAKFGLSRPLKGNEYLYGQFTLTEHIVGTKGYLAPEYLENGIVSPMLDVYSFGVLLLEMLTGKEVGFLYEGVKVRLSEILIPVLSEKNGISRLKEFMDSSLEEDYPTDIAYTMLLLVDRCLRKDPGNRPFMDEIVQILSKTVTTSLIWGSSTSASISSS